MKHLLCAVCISVATLTIQAKPERAVGYGAPGSPPAVLQADADAPVHVVATPPNSGTLETARFYFEEKSWKLAVDTADESDTATLTADENRELQYIKGQALLHLHNNPQAAAVFEALIAENPSDVWAGRALWRSQDGLDQNRWLDVSTTNPLKNLRAADRILTDLKPADLADFYMDVIKSQLPTLRYPEESDRAYILSFFDKVIPLLEGQEEVIADVQLRRQGALTAQTPDRPVDNKLAGWRGIVAEFPRTRAAATAQWQVAQHYISLQQFEPALYELAMLVSQFAGAEEAGMAAEEIVKIKRSEAIFSLSGQFLPGEKITFNLTARNTSRVRFTATPFNVMKELQRQKTTDLDLKSVTGKPTFTENVSVEDNGDFHSTTRTVTLNIKKAGVYVLRAEVDGKITCNAMLVISDLVLVGNTGPQGYEFWTVDAKTGRPRASAAITVAHNQKNDNHWLTGKSFQYFSEFDNLESGSDGFAEFKGESVNGQLFAVAASGDNIALLDNFHWSRFNHGREQEQPHTYLYTDRPVYRPEQKVYWRAILRNQAGGEYRVPTGMTYQVKVRDPKGQDVLDQKDMKLSEFGTLEGEIDLIAGAPLGQYQIQILDQRQNHFGNSQFRVEEYKKPEFEVSVESADDFARVGQPVKARVEAKYLFGSPVTDGTVKYTVRRSPRFRTMWDNMSWNLDDRDLGWFEEAPERPPVMHGSGGVIVSQGEGKLDADGNFTLTFDSTVPDNELQPTENSLHGGDGASRRMFWPPSPSTWDFQVEVTVTDASRRNIDASQVIPVGLKALNLAAKTQRTIVTPGDNARVELKSLNLADKPVPSSGTLYIEKLMWNEKAEEDDVTTVSSQAVSIEASGSLVLDWRVAEDLHGRLRFAYIAADPFGGESVAYASFYSASPDDTDIATRYQGVEIITDKTLYTVGETARIMILSEFKDAVAWYWIDTGSGNLHKQVLPLLHRTNFVSIPITEAFVPNSMIHIVAVRDKTIITDEVELIVPPTSRVINVEVVPAKSTVEPGETGQVSIRATDEAGAPVAAELSLSIFDQAITYIAPDTRPDIRRMFYGMKRPLRSDVRASINSSGSYGRFLIPASGYLNMAGDGENNLFRFEVPGQEMAFRDKSLSKSSRTAGVPAMAMAEAAPAAKAAPVISGLPDIMVGDFDNSAEAKAELGIETPAIRADFRDSMFWSPTIRTDAAGSATVDIKYPDSLTTWRMVAVGLTADTRVGNVTTDTVARKKVLARLQAPRFFRERDSVTISGNLHNYTNADLSMEATLRTQGVALDGATTMPLPGGGNENFMGNTQTVTVPAGGEKRVDWTVNVKSAQPGEAILNLMALSPGGSDAMQTTVPLMPHGIDKFVAWNGTSRDEATTGVTVETSGTARIITQTVSLPVERIKETTRLDIIVNPSLASSIREAIPYMIDYPYGCVEQTMSRFMPAAVAARAFQVLGYPLDQSMQERLPKVTAESLKRLSDMQLPSGGWGWWAEDAENLYMTSYVMYGLTLARDAEVTVEPAMMDSGLRRLSELRDDTTSKSLGDERDTYWYPNNLHNLMFAEYVLTLNNQSSSRTVELLWSRRDKLSAHGLAMLARTLGKLGRTPDAEVVLRNMVNMAVFSPENNTLRWGRIDGGWRWYDDPVEATAVGLMAYLDLKPDDPVVDQAMKWLVLNRQGGRWKSTRDTAQSVLALTQYMLQRKEAAKPVKIQVRAGGELIKTLEVTPENFWDFDGRITLRGDAIPDGDFPLSFTVEGEGNVYYSIYAEYFTLEEDIKKAGNEIYVTRAYEILDREQTTETVNGKASVIYRDKWLPLKEGDPLKSGDELRVTLKIKSLNDYEYLVFEDPKPAGMEAVDLQSGSKYGNGLVSNMELRDAWTAFFITTLRQGEHTLTYNIRAEIPGTFHAMPTTGYAMYFPPLRANADETVLKVVD